MKVSDIFLDAQEITGLADEATNFSRISDAVEIIANKGLIDAMQGYLELPVTSSRIVTLPRDVEVPVKVNVGDNPSFSRSKLYEFSMNGPGSNYSPTDWAWEDRGMVPVVSQPTVASTITAISTSNSGTDDGKTLQIWGRDATNTEVHDTLTLDVNNPPVSTHHYVSVTRVIKQTTAFSVTLQQLTDIERALSVYAPDETEPEYRQIKLSQSGTTAHILFRRSVYRISSQDDWIPVQSRMGLLLMLRAILIYRKGIAQDLSTADALQRQAESLVAEEQKSRNVFAEVASQTEQDSAHGLNINNRDSIIVADIYDDASAICGPIGKLSIFDSITDAVEMLDRKGRWDLLEGYVDISAFDSEFVTLPRYVETILGLNIGCRPAKFRNRWHEFHLNGPGAECHERCHTWTDMGDVVTLVDLTEAQGLIYKPDLSADNDKTVTVYGYDANDKAVTMGLTGNSMADFSSISSQTINRIDRISRQQTTGFAQLIAYNSTGDTSTQLGYYNPDETEPNYKRIKLPQNTCWIRLRYKKRTLKVASLSDQLHLRSRLAILAALASIQAMKSSKPDLQTSEAFAMKAIQLLNEEKTSRDPMGTWHLRFDTSTSMASPEQGFY